MGGHRFLYSEPFAAPRGVGGLAINRDRLSGNTATSAAHLRVQLATDVRMKPPTVLNHGSGGAHEPLRDSKVMRCEHDAPTAASSGKSRSVAFYATERRSLEHDSDHMSQCHHANKLATLQSTTKQHAATICTICSHRSQILRAHAERQMSASAAVTRWVRDAREAHQR